MKGDVLQLHVILTSLVLVYLPISDQAKTKRQIYREQVLPLSGGKIPEDAFRADRLALNRLNKEGIAVPDGILLEHRNVHSHPHENKYDPEDEQQVIHLIQQPDNRYVPDEGRYHNEKPLTVASTYLIRKPIEPHEANIRTPDQQRPLHQALLHNQKQAYYQQQQQAHPNYLPAPKYHRPPPSPPPPPSTIEHGYNRFSSYHHQTHYRPQHVKPLKLYQPIPVPFELPNKEMQSERYYLKSFEPNYPSGEDVSGRIEWPLIFQNYDKLHELNSILPQTGFEYDTHSYQYFESPETHHGFEGLTNYYGDRYFRRSAEGHVKGSEVKKRRDFESAKPSRQPAAKRRTQKCREDGNKCEV